MLARSCDLLSGSLLPNSIEQRSRAALVQTLSWKPNEAVSQNERTNSVELQNSGDVITNISEPELRLKTVSVSGAQWLAGGFVPHVSDWFDSRLDVEYQ